MFMHAILNNHSRQQTKRYETRGGLGRRKNDFGGRWKGIRERSGNDQSSLYMCIRSKGDCQERKVKTQMGSLTWVLNVSGLLCSEWRKRTLGGQDEQSTTKFFLTLYTSLFPQPAAQPGRTEWAEKLPCRPGQWSGCPFLKLVLWSVLIYSHAALSW